MSPSDAFSTAPAEPLCQVVTPVGMMGYGFQEDQTEAALKHFSAFPSPTALVLDAGSTDSGPSKLALGSTTCPRSSYVRDFRKLLTLSCKYRVPLLISSAGGDGSDEHVDLFLEIIREIMDEPTHWSWKLKALAVYSQLPKSKVLESLQAGEITGCGDCVPRLTAETVQLTPRIVAQMGPEPLLDAINAHPDYNVLIAGRAYDVAPFAVFTANAALRAKGLTKFSDLSPEELGSISHMGKMLECGGLCATPKSAGAQGILNRDFSFDIAPLDPAARCTALSVAAHTLYEKSRPDKLAGPGGYIDLAKCKFTPLDDGRSVRVRGSTFHWSRDEGAPYTVKLEGALVAGFRTLTMGSFKDPILIPQVQSFLQGARIHAHKQHTHIEEKWDIGFHVYGFDESDPSFIPNEVFIVAEIIAESQEVATGLASSVRVYLVHASYPDQKATSGNFAMGIGGIFELETKECAEFSIYHLIPLAVDEEGCRHSSLPQRHDVEGQKGLFRWQEFTIGHGSEYTGVGKLASSSDIQPVATKKVLKQPVHPVKVPASKVHTPPKTLLDVAKVIRSKNAGPFEVTLDVMFDNTKVYNTVKNSGILSANVIAHLFQLDESEVVWAGYFDVAMAFKATVPRKRHGKPACAGGFLETDVHGSQEYIPLTKLLLPSKLAAELSTFGQ